jgi:hypothetical protein
MNYLISQREVFIDQQDILLSDDNSEAFLFNVEERPDDTSQFFMKYQTGIVM